MGEEWRLIKAFLRFILLSLGVIVDAVVSPALVVTLLERDIVIGIERSDVDIVLWLL